MTSSSCMHILNNNKLMSDCQLITATTLILSTVCDINKINQTTSIKIYIKYTEIETYWLIN